MHLIECPFCGTRDEREFDYGGPARAIREDLGAGLDDESWREHVMVPDNVPGPIEETWVHARGCGMWLLVMRNTMTHEILSAKAAFER